MNNGQLDISTIIIVGVVALIGAILLAVGNRKNKRILRMVGIGVLMSAGVTLFVRSAELREILTAYAALVAVFIAAFSIDESRRMRQDSIERESRDRKERLIDEVAKWLRELEGRIFPKLAPIMSGTEDTLRRISSSPEIPLKTWLQLDNIDRTLGEVLALAEGIKEAEYYQKLTSQLNEELSSLIEVIASNLEQRRQLHVEAAGLQLDYSEKDKASQLQLIDELIKNDDRPLEGLSLSDQTIITIRLARNAHAIRKSILNAVDRAIELKTSLIQVP